MKIDTIRRTHDENGNLLDDGYRTFAYDFRDRLVAVSRKSDGAPLVSFEYDALGRRLRKIAYSTVTPGVIIDVQRFYYDDRWNVIEQRDENDVTEMTFVHGASTDEPIRAQRTAAGGGPDSYYLHQNARGDVVAVSDETGVCVEKARFDDFGVPETGSTVGNPYLFQGRWYDEETGLYEFRHRIYDPHTGRFLQRDPVLDSENLGNPYAFVGHGPVSRKDPSGLDWREDLKQAVGYSGDGVQRDSTIGWRPSADRCAPGSSSRGSRTSPSRGAAPRSRPASGPSRSACTGRT